MSDNRTPKTDDIAEHLRALDDVKQTATKVKAKLEGLHDEIGRLQLALEGERNTHDKTKAELDKTKQELSEARDKATNWQKRLREAEAKIDSAPKTVAEQWLEELGKSQLIGGLDRVIRGEAESNPADFRKRLVNWFGRRVNTKPEEVIAVGRQLVEKDSKSAAQIEWSPDTPFRDDVDAVEVEITYAGLRFGEIVIERARGNVIEVIMQATTNTAGAVEAEVVPALDYAKPKITSTPTSEHSDAKTAADPVSTSEIYSATPAAEPIDSSVESAHSTEFVNQNSVSASDGPEAAQNSVDHSKSVLPQIDAAAKLESADETYSRSESVQAEKALLSNEDYDIANKVIDSSGFTELDDVMQALRVLLRKLAGKPVTKQRAKELLENDQYKSILASFATSAPHEMNHYLKDLVDPRLRNLIEKNWPKK